MPPRDDERFAAEQQIENIDRLLTAAFDDGYPKSLVGDIHDLRVSLARFVRRLDEFFSVTTSHPRSHMEKELFQIRLQCIDILPMLFADIRDGIDDTIGPMDDERRDG